MAHGPCESPGAPWYRMQLEQDCPITKVGDTAASTFDASVVYFSAAAAGSVGLSRGKGPAAGAGWVADATGGVGSAAGAGAGSGAAAGEVGGGLPPPQALTAAPAAPSTIVRNAALRDTFSGLIVNSPKASGQC